MVNYRYNKIYYKNNNDNLNLVLKKYYKKGLKKYYIYIYINMNNYLDKLPQEVFNKIMLYNSDPVADLNKKNLN